MVSTSRDIDSYISHNAPAEYPSTDPPYLANNGYLVTRDLEVLKSQAEITLMTSS